MNYDYKAHTETHLNAAKAAVAEHVAEQGRWQVSKILEDKYQIPPTRLSSLYILFHAWGFTIPSLLDLQSH